MLTLYILRLDVARSHRNQSRAGASELAFSLAMLFTSNFEQPFSGAVFCQSVCPVESPREWWKYWCLGCQPQTKTWVHCFGEKPSLNIWKLLGLNTQLRLQRFGKILMFCGIQRCQCSRRSEGFFPLGDLNRMSWTRGTRRQPSGVRVVGGGSRFCQHSEFAPFFLLWNVCLLLLQLEGNWHS